MRIDSEHRALAALALGGLLTLAGCATTGPAVAPTARLPFPSPLTGPGRPAVEPKRARELEKGWKALEAGRPEETQRRAAAAGPGPGATLLDLQARTLGDPAGAVDGLRALVEESPGYAAAWLTLSEAAERAGDGATALAAARRGAALWGSPAWRARVTRLEDELIGEPLARGREALEAGDAPGAASLAEEVLEVDPANREARLLRARAALDQDDGATVESVLEPLGDDPEALLLRGRLAERRHRWMEAYRLYEALPPDHPLRESSMDRAKYAWRVSNLPPWVQEALRSPALTRAQLAVVLVSLAPQVEARATGTPPLLSDIVDLPSQREIVTAVRAGLLDADTLEHTFRPGDPAGVESTRLAIDRLCGLLGRTPPSWCDQNPGTGTCVALDDPPTGPQVASLLKTILEEPDHE